ncbi:hypothetical protein Moror_11768 [Moniliophthora roreri MCA 2997]|uniref:Uncharacterized protein n=1 Tax=Moniliophthora roreri (strain MCA 2997) TaxID=1381753 RepID=V2WRZ1_MONRO|nr:hypothetical protein Moror_11768 [Moniliophthora roreri MCA 2997]
MFNRTSAVVLAFSIAGSAFALSPLAARQMDPESILTPGRLPENFLLECGPTKTILQNCTIFNSTCGYIAPQRQSDIQDAYGRLYSKVQFECFSAGPTPTLALGGEADGSPRNGDPPESDDARAMGIRGSWVWAGVGVGAAVVCLV